MKRSVSHHITNAIGDSQEVCNTIVSENHQPTHGHSEFFLLLEKDQRGRSETSGESFRNYCKQWAIFPARKG